MTTAKFINKPREVVSEALEGLELAHPDIVEYVVDGSFIARRHRSSSKVAIVSGGGSGHEPLHAGFVGFGMLDAAVPGEVFASPTSDQVAAAARHVDSGSGILLIVKNYTGDVVNFSIATEELVDEGRRVETVVVRDDVATAGGAEGGPGRRGTGATVIIEKLCGALAERGATLEEVAELGRYVADNSSSIAVALGAGTHPGDTHPSFDLPSGQMEVGVGIHGERGADRRPWSSADETVASLLPLLIDDLGLQSGERVFVLTNGLGGTYQLELLIAHRAVAKLLEARGIQVARSIVGNYVTSLDMAGCLFTLVRADDRLVGLWDAPAKTAGWVQ